MRDSLNLIQGNDLGAIWLGHHDDLLLSIVHLLLVGVLRVRFATITCDLSLLYLH
jgi:hypothetical protein